MPPCVFLWRKERDLPSFGESESKILDWFIYIYIYIYDDDASGALFLRWPRSEGIIRFNAPFHCSVVTEVEQWFIKVSIKWLSVNA